VDVFTCTACEVTPELVTDGKAQLAIVRHHLGCPTLLAQTRTRWPAQVPLNAEAIDRRAPARPPTPA
jgi:hypothetical protein